MVDAHLIFTRNHSKYYKYQYIPGHLSFIASMYQITNNSCLYHIFTTFIFKKITILNAENISVVYSYIIEFDTFLVIQFRILSINTQYALLSMNKIYKEVRIVIRYAYIFRFMCRLYTSVRYLSTAASVNVLQYFLWWPGLTQSEQTYLMQELGKFESVMINIFIRRNLSVCSSFQQGLYISGALGSLHTT